MGKFDVRCKSFFSKSQNFADVINGAIFDGRMVINASDLVEAETERLSEENDKSYFVDVAKKWTLNGCNLMVLVLENQNYVDYSMVIRNLYAEILAYRKQIEDIKSYHKCEKDVADDEFLSGISKKDMLTPIITVVVYLGEKPWDGPKSLYDMVDLDKSLEEYIINYRLNLVDYHDFDDYGQFNGECKILFDALAARNSEEKTKDFVNNNEEIHHNTARLVGEILKIKFDKSHIKKTEEGDVVLMCKAWDDHYNSGKKEERENTVISMIKDSLSVEKIMKYVNISLDELKSLSEKIGVSLTY